MWWNRLKIEWIEWNWSLLSITREFRFSPIPRALSWHQVASLGTIEDLGSPAQSMKRKYNSEYPSHGKKYQMTHWSTHGKENIDPLKWLKTKWHIDLSMIEYQMTYPINRENIDA